MDDQVAVKHILGNILRWLLEAELSTSSVIREIEVCFVELNDYVNRLAEFFFRDIW